MWTEKMKNGKVRFVERYIEPLTGQTKKVSVVLDKNTTATQKQATEVLQARINDALSSTCLYVKQDNLTLEELVNHKVTSPKTVTSNRDVFMQPELEKLLHEIRKDTNKRKMLYGFRSNLLFCDRNGDYLRYYSFNKYLKETSIATLGRPITTHVLRHTHVSAGVPLETITRRVGHEDGDITKRVYLHVTERMKERDNEIVSRVSLI